MCVRVCGLEGQRTPIKILQLLSAVFEAIFVLSAAETLIPTSIDCTVSLRNKLWKKQKMVAHVLALSNINAFGS